MEYREELKKLKVIEAIPHVISADMQMAYSEEELSTHIEVLENADAVPRVLNDKNIKPENIVYNGDLKKKDLEGFAKTFDQNKISRIYYGIFYQVIFYAKLLFQKRN